MKKILITGASGFLGWYLCQHAVAQGWAVHGTFYSKQPQIPNVTRHRLDLTDREAVKTLIEQLQPQAVIHAAAMGRPNDCQKNPDASYTVNVEATARLASYCDRLGCKCVFISSEQVFDGTNPPYSEVDPVSPINTYGEHKAIAEQEVLAINPNNLVCRLPLLFGMVPHASNFLQECLDKLQQRQPLTLFVDEIRSPIFGADAARGILLGLNHLTGIVHISGPEPISRHEFGQKVVAAKNLSDACLYPVHQVEMTFSAPRPANLTLISHVASSIRFMPQTVSSAMETLFRE